MTGSLKELDGPSLIRWRGRSRLCAVNCQQGYHFSAYERGLRRLPDAAAESDVRLPETVNDGGALDESNDGGQQAG